MATQKFWDLKVHYNKRTGQPIVMLPKKKMGKKKPKSVKVKL